MLIYTTVLFDLDGTLLDPLEDAAAAVNYMCRKFGLPERTPEQVSAGMGRGITNLVMSSLPEGCGISVGDAEDAYRRHYGEHYLDNSKAYGGVMKMLSELKKAGAKTAVISNKAHEYTEKICGALFGDCIDVCIGETPGVPLKPDPAPVKKALELLGAAPQSSVYVGDTDVDIQTAQNSGLRCIACAWGLRGREFLLRHGADPRFLADTPLDVLRILRGG